MSGDEMIEGKESKMEVEGKSSDRILNDSVVNEGKGKEKDPPFSRPPDQNPTENVELRVMEKDEIIMEDAEKLSKDETCDANATNSVDEMVLDNTDATKSVETVPDNQQFVEVTVDIKGVGANGMCDNGQSQELKKNGDNDEKGVGETDIGAGVEEVALNDKSGSDDVLALDEKSLEANVEEGEKCVPLKDYPLGAQVVGKGGELKDKPLLAKVEDGTKKDDLSEKPLKAKAESGEQGPELTDVVNKMELSQHTGVKEEVKIDAGHEVVMKTPSKSFLLEPSSAEGYESGTEEEQAEFLKDVETFYRENSFEFKAPKFYKEELNLLKLWRAVIKLGGYEQVTSCKLWRQVGESFRPPKTCTTVSWTFRIFYEKALLEYEKHKMHNGELPFTDGTLPESIRDENQAGGSQAFGSGRARRDAAARAMQGWHSQRLLDNGQVCQPIIKDKSLSSTPKGDKQQKTNGLLKRKKPSTVERAVSVTPMKTMKQQGDTMVIDIGPPADWVKINVQKTNDCFEIYALVPGLLREEVHVQSDPAGRLIISGQPEQLDNPWGVTPFKKVVSLPSRIDPHQTSAVVTLHGQLFVRVPFEQPDH